MRFRYKITFCMVSLLALFYGIGGTILISGSFHSALEREKEAARQSNQMIIDTLQVVNEIDSQSSDSTILEILGQLSLRNNSTWDALRLKSETNVIYENGEAVTYFQDMSQELEQGQCLITHFSDENEKQYLQISSYISKGKRQLLLEVAFDITSIYESRAIQQRVYYRIYSIMLALCFMIVYMIAYLLTRPLSSLSKATRRIASGNLSYRAMIKTNDEIGILAEDFNAMAAQVEQSVETMQKAMEQQEQFMGSFTHELKTPMTSMIGYADLIRRQTLSQEEEAEAANYIYSEGKRLERLSLKMLDIFSVEQRDIPLLSVSPAALIHEMVEELEPVYQEKGIRLACECEEGTCQLEPDLVRSLLLNLLDNSRKAITEKGKIVIHSIMIPEGCQITVIDNGAGVPSETMEHLTEAFYRVDKARSRKMGGAGLGLTLCAKIVEIHNGTMSFQPNGEHGLQVLVELKGGR